MDTDLTSLWKSRSKPQPPLDAEAHFGEGISVRPIYFRSALPPFRQTFISPEMKETLYFATQTKKPLPHPGPGFRNFLELMLSRKGQDYHLIPEC